MITENRFPSPEGRGDQRGEDLEDLARGEVHVWCVALDVAPATAADLYRTLSGEERDRAARPRFPIDRRRFIVARGALRDILGRYLGMHPGRVSFAYNAFGKPELGLTSGKRLKFNLSHSAGCALVAITADADVGVDLEYIRPELDHSEIARCFFSAAEVDQLNRVPSHAQSHAFFESWTKREAYVKARGEGLDQGGASGDAASDSRWSVYSIQPAPGYIGALVVEGNGRLLRQWDWLPPDAPALGTHAQPGAHELSDPFGRGRIKIRERDQRVASGEAHFKRGVDSRGPAADP